MASSKDYLQFVLEQLSELQEITYRAMMGEFIIYYRGKIVGGIYDDRLLVKPTKSAISYMPTVTYEIPYENAKEMLLVEEVDNKDFLDEIQDILLRCGMGEIYIVNPYECFLLMCLLTDCPLAVFSEIWEKSYEEGEAEEA